MSDQNIISIVQSRSCHTSYKVKNMSFANKGKINLLENLPLKIISILANLGMIVPEVVE